MVRLNLVRIRRELMNIVLSPGYVNVGGWDYWDVVLVHDTNMLICSVLSLLRPIEWV